MFPLSAPTDSLYKFISLFGLAIFIMASYKSGKAWEASANNRVQIEAIKKEIRLAMLQRTTSSSVEAAANSIEQLPDDLDAILQKLSASHLPLDVQLTFDGEIRKLKVQKASLTISVVEYITTVVAGIVLIALGFILWYKRDQLLKDRLLKTDVARRSSP